MSIKKYYRDRANIAMCVGDDIIEFKPFENGGIFVTEDAALQKGIESHYLFGSVIKADKENEADSTAKPAKKETIAPTQPQPTDATIIEDVTSLQEAKELLRGEPWNVHFSKINTPKNIFAKAKELNIVFPNLAE